MSRRSPADSLRARAVVKERLIGELRPASSILRWSGFRVDRGGSAPQGLQATATQAVDVVGRCAGWVVGSQHGAARVESVGPDPADAAQNNLVTVAGSTCARRAPPYGCGNPVRASKRCALQRAAEGTDRGARAADHENGLPLGQLYSSISAGNASPTRWLDRADMSKVQLRSRRTDRRKARRRSRRPNNLTLLCKAVDLRGVHEFATVVVEGVDERCSRREQSPERSRRHGRPVGSTAEQGLTRSELRVGEPLRRAVRGDRVGLDECPARPDDSTPEAADRQLLDAARAVDRPTRVRSSGLQSVIAFGTFHQTGEDRFRCLHRSETSIARVGHQVGSRFPPDVGVARPHIATTPTPMTSPVT